MADDRWQQAKELLQKALELEPEQRAAFLVEAYAKEPTLREELESLIASLEQVDLPMENPPLTETLTVTRQRVMEGAQAEAEEIGPYRILHEIGHGGMGVVYKAEQKKPVRRKVALKLIKWGMDTKEVIARFESERQALALMNHENIATVHDAGATEQGRPYFAMEYVQGIPITEYCDKYRLTIKERLDLFIQVCKGVQHAHQKGIIHRDIKPSNVLVAFQDGNATPKIIDFGVAKATFQRLTEHTVYTELGELIGTPEYMSPEQAEITGLDIDTRTDVYSLGVLLYELLVGAQPFDPKELRSSGFDEFRRKIREVDPLKPSTRLTRLGDTAAAAAKNRRVELSALTRQLRGDLNWITMMALEKDRTRRYDSASALAADIDRHLSSQPVVAGPPSTTYRVGKFVRRHKMGVGAAAVLILAMLLGIVGTTAGLLRAIEAEGTATQEAETARQVSDFLVNLFGVVDPSEALGNTITAREILDEGADKIRRELEDQPLLQARLMTTMGNVYTSLGLYDSAETLLEESLALREEHLGPRAPDTIGSIGNLGRLLWSKGEHDEAIALHERALSLSEETLGPEDPAVAEALVNLGNVVSDAGDLQKGRECYERSLGIYEAALGPDHTDVARVLNNLGLTLYDLGEYDASRQSLERALAIRESTSGSSHYDLADPLHNLGMVHNAIGDAEEARRHFERALEIYERVLDPDHPDVAITVNQIAILLAVSGDLQGARALFERVLAIDEKSFGPEHFRVGNGISNLGLIEYDLGNYDEARSLLERGLAIKQKHLGPNHPFNANDLASLAAVLEELGDLEDARTRAEDALEIREEALGPDHPDVAGSLVSLGALLHEMGEYVQAEAHFERGLRIQEEKLGPDHPHIADTLEDYAELLRTLGRTAEAEQMDSRAAATREE